MEEENKEEVSKNVRIQIDLPEANVQALDKLAKELKLATRKELFNYALTLLVWSVRECKQGRSIVSWDENKKECKELVLPIFTHVYPTK